MQTETAALGRIASRLNFYFPLRYGYLLALTLLVASVAIITFNGVNRGIDFTGGRLLEVRFDQPVPIAEIRGSSEIPITIQQIRGENSFILRQTIGTTENLESRMIALGATIVRSEYVGPIFGQELALSAGLAVVMALALVLIYLWVRFRVDFATSAIFCLIHDVMFTIAVMSILSIELNIGTVAALLTIAGYSINDTVVIFDRVRELTKRYQNALLIEALNLAVKQTLRRTILTTVTTFMSVLALTAIGGTVIAQFCQVILFGLIIGTASSVLVACSLFHTLAVRFAIGKKRTDATTDRDSDIPERFR